MSYYFSTTLAHCDWEEAKEKVAAALQEEGFGILTEIDVQNTLKKKLDVTLKPYTILGACNPAFAYKALQAEQNIGVMLPCNIVMQEGANHTIDIVAIDPVASMKAVNNDQLSELATEVRTKMQQVIRRIEEI